MPLSLQDQQLLDQIDEIKNIHKKGDKLDPKKPDYDSFSWDEGSVIL